MRYWHAFPAILLSFAAACPLSAAESLYVVCDNGLRCVRAPCPSSTARDLATGEAFKGVSPVLDGLPEADRERIRQTDALYFGRLVLKGHVQRGDNAPSALVVTGIVREATAEERKGCPAG